MHKFLLLFPFLLIFFIADAQDSDNKKVQNRLSNIEKSFKEVSKIIDKGGLSTDSLKSLNQILISYRDSLFTITASLNKQINDANLNLTNLGPVPEDGDPSEPDNVTKRRKDLNNQISTSTGLTSSANVLLTDIADSMEQISKQRNSIFLSGITDRTYSPLTPDIWKDAEKERKDLKEKITNYYSKTWTAVWTEDNKKVNVFLLLLSIIIAILILIFPQFPFSKKLIKAYKIKSESPEINNRLNEIVGPLLKSIIIFFALYIVYLGANEVGLITKEVSSFYMKIIFGIALSVFIWNYSKKVFNDKRPIWKRLECAAGKEKTVSLLFFGMFLVFAINQIFIAGFNIVNSGMKLFMIQMMLLTGVFAVLFFLFLSSKLWKFSNESSSLLPKENNNETKDLAPDHKIRLAFEFVQYLGRIIAIFILLAIFLEYVRLANFVFHRIVLTAIFVIGFTSIRNLGKWGIYELINWKQKPTSSNLKKNTTNDKATKIQSINFWLDTVFDIVLFTLSIPSFLYVFGLGWIDLSSWLDYLSTGFKIGAITISFKNIFTGIFVFFIIILSTRWATSMIGARLKEYTGMDSGLQNSIITILNYFGVVVAIFAAFPILGLNFSKLAVIAGALSVGIGFGLQNIVKDFVSGLILLIERPIKIGDWVVVDAGQGYVKEIKGRVTVIQGFDLSMIIVPNSELVTSPVQNLFYQNKRGRVSVAIGVDYKSDPEQVKKILLECASENTMVISSPQSYVIWSDFADNSLNFELRAFIKNSDYGLTIKSDLRFAIFKKFKQAGIKIPFPQRDVHIMEKAEDTINTISSEITSSGIEHKKSVRKSVQKATSKSIKKPIKKPIKKSTPTKPPKSTNKEKPKGD